MESNKLPERVETLKREIKEKVREFNKEVGIPVTGVLVEARVANDKALGREIVMDYEVGVQIEL